MTPAQLDHLRAIDAHLTALLELAAKRSTGEWKVNNPQSRTIRTNQEQSLATMSDDSSKWQNNATFIASCAGNAEAGWRSTKAAIKMLKFLTVRTCDDSCGGGLPHCSDVWIDEILTAWPIEKLKLP